VAAICAGLLAASWVYFQDLEAHVRAGGEPDRGAAASCDPVTTGIVPPAKIDANTATALAFTPDGRLMWAERSGLIHVFQNGRPQVFGRVVSVTVELDGTHSERGVTGLAISPTYETDHYVYAMYSDADYTHEDVIRWRDCGGVGIEPTTILVLPSGSNCCHKAGRLAFGPDGDLYVALGDEDSSGHPHPGFIPPAQLTSTPLGKILRYEPDGSIPPDNPFGPDNPTWVYGLRNPFGIAFNDQGQLLVTMNGPSADAGSPKTGYDTVDLAIRGGNYGWPYCYGYGHLIKGNNVRRGCGAGAIQPVWSSEAATVVPTGPAWIRPGGPANIVGHWVVCSAYKGMLVLTPDTPHWDVTVAFAGCQLDVKQAPDGTVYYSDFKAVYRAGSEKYSAPLP
jgi:glucose/arabinose dehydrogenase